MLEEMLRRALTPEVVSHSAAISACEKGKHWEEALRMLQEQLEGILDAYYGEDRQINGPLQNRYQAVWKTCTSS